jgi:TetR/AcrR family fatty acid metabolism transcriptional regulator
MTSTAPGGGGVAQAVHDHDSRGERARRGAPRRSAHTRERILAAATRVFARRGFHGSRVSDIAEEAGMAYGLVYHHFRNKEEILAAIYAEKWGEYIAYLIELSRRPLSFAERMARLVHFWLRIFRQDPDLMTVIINEITRSYEFMESHDIATVLAAFDAIQVIVDEGVRSGEVRSGVDARLATYMVLGTAEMVLSGYVLGTLRREAEEDWERDERQLVDLLLHGLAGAGPEPAGD